MRVIVHKQGGIYGIDREVTVDDRTVEVVDGGRSKMTGPTGIDGSETELVIRR